MYTILLKYATWEAEEPTVRRLLLRVEVPIPTLPLPLTNNMLEEAGEDILSRLADDAPEMCREADGFVVPVPTLPVEVKVIASGVLSVFIINLSAVFLKTVSFPPVLNPSTASAVPLSSCIVNCALEPLL